jgi:hypothetical protein
MAAKKKSSSIKRAASRNYEKARRQNIAADIEFDNFVANRFGVPAGETGRVRKIKKGGKLKTPSAKEQQREADKSKKAFDRHKKKAKGYTQKAKKAAGEATKRSQYKKKAKK